MLREQCILWRPRGFKGRNIINFVNCVPVPRTVWQRILLPYVLIVKIFPAAKQKVNRLNYLAEVISRWQNIESVAWLLLMTIIHVHNFKNSQ